MEAYRFPESYDIAFAVDDTAREVDFSPRPRSCR